MHAVSPVFSKHEDMQHAQQVSRTEPAACSCATGLLDAAQLDTVVRIALSSKLSTHQNCVCALCCYTFASSSAFSPCMANCMSLGLSPLAIMHACYVSTCWSPTTHSSLTACSYWQCLPETVSLPSPTVYNMYAQCGRQSNCPATSGSCSDDRW